MHKVESDRTNKLEQEILKADYKRLATEINKGISIINVALSEYQIWAPPQGEEIQRHFCRKLEVYRAGGRLVVPHLAIGIDELTDGTKEILLAKAVPEFLTKLEESEKMTQEVLKLEHLANMPDE